QQHDVGQVTGIPPTLNVFPKRAAERKTTAIEPLVEILDNIVNRRFQSGTDAARDIIQHLVRLSCEAGMVIVKAPKRIPAVAGDIDVLNFGRKHERVQGKVSLQESTMLLRLKAGYQLVQRNEPKIHPRRCREQIGVSPFEDQLRHDLLR